MTQGWTGHPGPSGTTPAHGSVASVGGDLVTGEAVLLELRLAKLPSRAVAELLDLLAMFAAFLLLIFVGGESGLGDNLDSAAAAGLGLVVVLGIFIGYPVLFEVLSSGRSLGKMAMGLRVVRDDGGPISFRHALARGLLSVFELYLTSGAVAIIVSLLSSKGKRVGDYVAGTVVVRERVPRTSSAPMVSMPIGLESWAATLELSRLPDSLALSVRQFLSRVNDLDRNVRGGMGARLAHEVSTYVAPPPPYGCPPEAYLAAVLAERRRREQERYAGPGSTATYTATYSATATPGMEERPFRPPDPPGPPPADPSGGFTLPS